jgi:uncharacterized protein YbbC (DUF1343 family)
VHGLTLGEIAQLHRTQQDLDLDLRVVRVQNWTRAIRWPDTGLPWIAPSPNLPDYEAAAWYPATCLLEFSGVSVGRGTHAPFHIVGAPWMDAMRVLEAAASWPASVRDAVRLESIEFVPSRAVHEGELCRGIRLRADRVEHVPLVPLGLALLHALHSTHPEEMNEEKLNAARPLIGSLRVLEALRTGDLEAAITVADRDAQDFQRERAPFLLYG